MKQKREVRYYHIRASVFWMIVVIVIGFTMIFWKATKNAGQAADKAQTEHMEYGNIVSTLENNSECYLCGSSSQSLMDYYRKFDTIGVIGLNEWHVLDLGLKKYDSQGLVEVNQDGSGSMFGNTQGVSYRVSSTPSRGMASVTMSSENGMFDETMIKQHLCQPCLDKVADTLEGYFEKGKEEYLPFCIVDFATLDLYSVQKQNVAYFVRDYWVTLECDEDIEIDVYYWPER